ncbi:hypothetical protein BDR22DRAFT_876988 [Usnea florida]
MGRGFVLETPTSQLEHRCAEPWSQRCGPEWSLYVTFERELRKLITMGPLKLGPTLDTIGTWAIVFKLNFIAHWGWTRFRPWFKDRIMIWCRWIAEQPLMDLHFMRDQNIIQPEQMQNKPVQGSSSKR